MPCKVSILAKQNISVQFNDGSDLQRFLLAFAAMQKIPMQLSVKDVKIKHDGNMMVHVLKEGGFSYNDLVTITHHLISNSLPRGNITDILTQGWKELDHKYVFFGLRNSLPSCSISIKKGALEIQAISEEFIKDISIISNALLAAANEKNKLSAAIDEKYNTVTLIFSHSNLSSTVLEIRDAFIKANIIDRDSEDYFVSNMNKLILKDILSHEIQTLKILLSNSNESSPMAKYASSILNALDLMSSALESIERNELPIKWNITEEFHALPKVATKGIEKILREFPRFVATSK